MAHGTGMRYQKFMTEMTDNEARLRLKWVDKYMEEVYKNVPKYSKPKNVDLLIKELHKARAEHFENDRKLTEKKQRVSTIPKVEGSYILPTMKPVPSEVSALLYRGVSHDDEGRKQYLTTRYKNNSPGQRYYFPETTSFIYGWYAEELGGHMARPQFGHTSKNAELYFRRQGTAPEYENYRTALRDTMPVAERI